MTVPPAALDVGQLATLACLLEATAPKPGNVHRGADFEDLTFLDFQLAAVAIGPAMQRAAEGARVGETVLAAIRATRQLTATNVNLGIVLLLAPLAAVPAGRPTRLGLQQVLKNLAAADAGDVYDAIRIATPGGMGEVPEADVAGPAPDDLLHAMRLAADRDAVARQYANDFVDVFDIVVPELERWSTRGLPISDVIVRTFLRTMHELPDTLIARKCGLAKAQEAAAWAGQVLEAGMPGDDAYHEALADLDFELRSDGHRLNPGTTADLICAGLFVALRDKILVPPLRF
jgi:triphosphoribosyl-dephospho-CoA synthase